MPRTDKCVIRVIFLTLLIAAVEGATCSGSEITSHVMLQLNLRGELEPGRVARSTLSLNLPEMEFLQSDVVQNELEVLDHQREALQDFFDRHQKAAAALKDDWLSERLAEGVIDAEHFQRRIAALEQKIRLELEHVLLPFQLARLEQIRFRCKVRTHGMCTLLSTGELGSSLGLDMSTRLRVAGRARKEAVELLAMAEERRRRVIDELLEILTDDQRQELHDQLGEYYYGTNSNLEVLIWQLGYEGNGTSGEFAGFRANVWFRVSVDGKLEPAPRPALREKKLVEVVLPQLFLNEGLVNGLGLSDDQMFHLELLKDEYKRTLNSLDRQLQGAVDTGVVTNRHENANLLRTLAKRREDALTQLNNDFHGVLGTDQFQRLKRLDSQLDVLRRGYVATLTDGTLGKVLGTTVSQKSALKTTARKLRSGLIHDTAKWQAAVDQALMAELPVEARSELQRRMGPPLSSTPGNTTLLLLDLAR